ncbi:S8 family serine peptidase, partial [Pseudomonas sp. 2822-15]|uniref:S8 family serine peptidase n=1 Tax=Pseudomonas sp. 2822-15 TaxID=1712677 RepID=UPI00273A7323
MAAPHAAGVAGLVRAVNPNLSVAEVRNILADTAQYAGSSHQYGNGIVDAFAAVQAAGGSGGTPSPGVT